MTRILVLGGEIAANDETKAIEALLKQMGAASCFSAELTGQTTRVDGEFPDLVLCASDYEVNLASVKSNAYLKNVPVIAIVDDLDEATPLLDLGIHDLIQRPIVPALLTKRIENCAKSQDIAALYEGAKVTMREMTMYDSLTELLNRRYFLSQALRELARALRFGHSYSMIIVEPDNFKQINAEKGSDVGDQVLKHLAVICTDMARQIDVVGRFSGSEFVICCTETGADGARIVAERILDKIGQSVIPTSEGAIEYSVSVGVSELGPLEMDISPLLKRVDNALVDAKGKGGAQVCLELLKPSAESD